MSADEVDDLPEPGRAWKTPQHDWDPEHGSKNGDKHWRQSFWKRRSAVRAARAASVRALS
ncbi:MAG: hypothetical protein OEW42_10510 [Acidimicrobiia bacterium]|nr:hypothetical protein [Acidimicrobiia bacterium]